MGPPGIGKTQIMEQAARECGVALVAYTITHHTRQSAVGLPFIRQKHYGDRDVSVTEYTMSEIIASIYEKMEATGLQEGILFIDEINCVSETLAPTMLQFLQCKTFGNQAVPAGWVIVAAGNPPNTTSRSVILTSSPWTGCAGWTFSPTCPPGGNMPARWGSMGPSSAIWSCTPRFLSDQRRRGGRPVRHGPGLGGSVQPAGHLRKAGDAGR